jgi:hypothetical protein
MGKAKIGDKYIVPIGTQLWFVNLQQSFITTTKYVVEVKHTIWNSDTCFFGDLFTITFEHIGIPGLMKVIHGEVSTSLDKLKPLGDILEPKFMDFKYNNE